MGIDKLGDKAQGFVNDEMSMFGYQFVLLSCAQTNYILLSWTLKLSIKMYNCFIKKMTLHPPDNLYRNECDHEHGIRNSNPLKAKRGLWSNPPFTRFLSLLLPTIDFRTTVSFPAIPGRIFSLSEYKSEHQIWFFFEIHYWLIIISAVGERKKFEY
jgi:hypothetical protein